MKRPQPFAVFMFFLIVLLAGCLSARPSQTNNEPSPQPALTLSIPQPTSTSIQPTDTFTQIPTSATPTSNDIQYRPLEILADIPSDVQIDEPLVLQADPSFILFFGPQKKIVPIDVGNGWLRSPSPNGKWLAYETYPPNFPNEINLVIDSVDRKQHYEVTVDKITLCSDTYLWLDDQHLICPLNPDSMTGVAAMLVINPFTGQQETLASDYPNLFVTITGLAPRMNFRVSDVVYSPSLDQVVYPQREPPYLYIVLWDRKSKTALVKMVQEGGDTEQIYPLWSPDGKSVAVALWREGKGFQSIIDEWYLMTVEGQVEQLTHWGDSFADVKFGSGDWSPDGKWLAFWMDAQPSQCAGNSLVIMELATKQLTNTCVMSKIGWPPVWSVDSRYIAVKDSDADQTILIDVNQWWAAQIPEAHGAIPLGWLTNSQ